MRDLSDSAKDAQQRYPLGLRVRGIVTDHRPFGVFVDLGDPRAVGLVQIIDFVDDGRMTPNQFPTAGTSIEAVVIGWKDTRWQDYPCEVALSVKPSELRKSEREKLPVS
jgi:ribosomal protein S1